ncbi:MAG: hypothetical protein JXR13_14065 [Thalassovita sp.]
MYHKMKRRLLSVAFVCLGSGPLIAGGIGETNYLHIDPANSLTLEGFFSAKEIVGHVIVRDAIQVGTAFAQIPAGDLTLSVERQERDSVAFLFDEEICTFGFQISLPHRAQRNSILVEMRFFARDGSVVNELRRQPALGTTLQAYSSDQFTHRFAGVEIATHTIGEMALGEIRAMPCSLMIS